MVYGAMESTGGNGERSYLGRLPLKGHTSESGIEPVSGTLRVCCSHIAVELS